MYDTLIQFRSTKAKTQSIGTANQSVKNHGIWWSHIREYHEWDDSRDIAWNRTSERHIYTREREENGNFDILLYIRDIHAGDAFFTETHPLSKEVTIKKLEAVLRESAKKWRHTFSIYSWEMGKKYLEKKKPKNTLICIVDENYEGLYKKLSYHNDVLFIDILHPFEENPSSDVLFFSKILRKEKYKKAFTESKKKLKENVKKIWWEYISLYTHESIQKRLNYFFKNRFKTP